MNLKEIEKLYTNNLSKFGINHRAVGWNSIESQNLRFEKLLYLISNREKKITVNELGCGYGEFYKYLLNNNFNFRKFNGYDISKAMLNSCRKYLSSPKELKLFNSPIINTKADYTFSSGVFNIPFKNSELQWNNHIEKTILNMYEYSKIGIAFNFLSSYVDFRSENLFYQNPEKILKFCLQNFGKKIHLIHDYPLYEFTILIYKN